MLQRVLVVDDDEDQCAVIGAVVRRLGLDVETTTSPSAAIELLRCEDFTTVVTDIAMDEMSGIELTRKATGIRPDVPVIVLTGFGSMDSAVDAMRVGAYDYLAKPVDPNLLGLAIARASKHFDLADELRRPREIVVDRRSVGNILGESPGMLRVRELIARVASTDASVLIQGETGTGKELVVRAIHDASARSRGPFVAVNCASIPPALLESELFGHARGAFTDAKHARRGLFARATGGTLFLDEVGEMALAMQPKILRALQERVVRPVGSDAEIPIDVRIISATHRDLEVETLIHRFREDLFYRLNVVRIDVPALRDRGSDVLTLARHFLGEHAKRTRGRPLELGVRVAERFVEYDWPGNVRELENCIERAVALSRFEYLTLDDLPERIRDFHGVRSRDSVLRQDEALGLDSVERAHIARVLKVTGGNKTRAAQLLGLDRRTLHRKLDRYAAESAANPDTPKVRLSENAS